MPLRPQTSQQLNPVDLVRTCVQNREVEGVPGELGQRGGAVQSVRSLETLSGEELDQPPCEWNVVIHDQDFSSAHVTPIRRCYFFSAGNRVSIGCFGFACTCSTAQWW